MTTAFDALIDGGARLTDRILLRRMALHSDLPALEFMFRNSFRAYCPAPSIVANSRKKLKTIILSLRFNDSRTTFPKPVDRLGNLLATNGLIMRNIFMENLELRQDTLNILLDEIYDHGDLSTALTFDDDTRRVAARFLFNRIVNDLEEIMEDASGSTPAFRAKMRELIQDPHLPNMLFNIINTKIEELKEAHRTDKKS